MSWLREQKRYRKLRSGAGPAWLYTLDGKDESFWDRRDRGCAGQGTAHNPFYLGGVCLVTARELCESCPYFEPCLLFSLTHHEWVGEGTYAGLTQRERQDIVDGPARFRDWREDFNPMTEKLRVTNNALEALKTGKDGSEPGCPHGHEAFWVKQIDAPEPYRCTMCEYRFDGPPNSEGGEHAIGVSAVS